MVNDLFHPDPAGMSAGDHIAEAERLLMITGMGRVEQALNRAQVHASLAIAKQLRERGENVAPVS